MLNNIIREVLLEIEPTIGNIDEKTIEVAREIKDIAKKLFFEGKINDLKDFIFETESFNNSSIMLQLKYAISYEKKEEFILKLKSTIQTEIEKKNLKKDLPSLLEILDYGHLKGFLQMFKL